MKKIITITFNRLDISWGPAVHYLELWNSFKVIDQDEYGVIGLAPASDQKPIIKPAFKIKFLAQPNIPKVRQILYDLRVAIKLLAIKKGTIIYLRNGSVAMCSLFVIRIKKLKLVLELNGIAKKDTDSSKERNWISTISILSEKKLIQYASAIIAVSDGIKAHAEALGGTNVHCLENGIGSSFFTNTKISSGGKLKIVYVGTFTPWDGAARIIDLAAEFENIEFHLYGDGAAANSLKQRKTDNVFFHGYVPYSSLPEIYYQYDAGIVLYDIERNDMKISSLKTLEYAASRLPIFSSRVPGQEYIEENGIGFLSDLSDYKNDFATFINSIDEYKKNAVAYQELLYKTKSWTAVASKTKTVIDSLIIQTS